VEEKELLPEIAATHGLEVILEWGHPDGLRMGTSQAAVRDLRSWIAKAAVWSFPILRIVAGYPTLRGQEPVDAQMERLVPILRELCLEAKEVGVTIAIENHADFTPSELQALICATVQPNLRAVLDVGNCVRLGEELLSSVRCLLPWVDVVHLRDLVVLPESLGNPLALWPTAPLGCGSLDIAGVLQELQNSEFQGSLLLELSPLHADWAEQEDEVIHQSLAWLKEWHGTHGISHR
jgi:3-oxoisoapionate decarboxylase